MVKEIRTEIEINAPPERVWRQLTDFAAFPKWNPFIRSAAGEPREGSRLEVNLQPSGARAMTFRPRVLKAEPQRELRWLGRLAIPGLFSGEHIFSVEPRLGGGTRFVQREIFRGLLVPLMAKSLDRDAKRGFEEMNRALKERAEGSQ
jgi:hypothetical protein